MIPLSFDFHENSPTDNQIHTVPVYIPSNKKAFSIQFFSETAGDFRNVPLNIHLFNPGNSKNDQSNYTEKSVARNEKCEQPIYLDRNDWCPTCPEDSTPEFTIPTHLIIHHSAGSNSSSDWSAVVRSIWDYHVNVRGWDDIGYNWLIDPNGLLYEGRGNDRQGAHFCGYNGETLGCCMMGTYTNTKPSDASRETLVELMAWKADELDIDPTTSSFHNSSGLELKHVSGHRDGCSTECPGGSFYADFDDLRSDIKKYIAEECREQVIIDPVISLSPNPTRGFFTLQNPYEEKLDMEIFSMDGKLVLRDLIEANSGLFIDLPQLPNGIYIILLNGATVHWKNKFVVL
jgi:hypothetical protein